MLLRGTLRPSPSGQALTSQQLWFKDKEVRETKFSKEQSGPPEDYKLEKVARDGPKWGPMIQVDVVVRLVDRENRTYLLKAWNQWIGRRD